ncbi:GNAT family N-acetyltransferase [Iningainema tapete]|uniref:GNAT family N-acetyltransferase n=1 Tax=Iningainema tapete BLCC-T55 TaxID=2748662 RepID=A0A8J7BZY0_9CYAN|nr:GNAT family N-acetyltransferase [Iningainema tapete]MBD2776958.1 GNAT family N-acetyltransferase [Iningainema tapete BLCC-T55]
MESNEPQQFTIQEISQNSKHLETIIQLGDANSTTLGFLPYGAFRRLAAEGRILGYIVPEAGCVAYLLYDISGYKVKLTHLCVDKMWQGRGIARALIKHLSEKTPHLHGILASCRRDYKLDGMWASLGFVAVHERPGRSKDGTTLTEWWLNYGHPNLLTTLTQQKTESRICVAMDTNIFYDLANNETSNEESKESKALIADWLEPELELCLTDEIKNEINKNKDSEKRKKLRLTADKFTFLPCTQNAFNEACQAIRKFFPEDMKESNASDFRQLARVIGSSIKAPFFITREQRLLEIEEEIYKEFNVLIIQPIELIIRLDELRRETDYQPIRLAGTSIEKKRVQSGEQESIIDTFICHETENKDDFRKRIRQFILNPKQFECFTIGRREELIALIVYDRAKKHELKVPVCRFKDTQFTPTIIRHCIFQCFSTAASEQRQFTRISETNLQEHTAIALQEDRFLKTEDGWLRTNLAITCSSAEISSYISNLCKELGKSYEQYLSLVEILTDQDLVSNINLMADIEGMLYPAKITDAEIPNFIIPIQAWWAKDLFDKELAEQVIWGAKEDLALRREVVYYRSKQASGGLKAPGRILWYVSKAGSGRNNSSILGAIRACSRLDEIVIDKPTDLHKRFRRLGIYSFKDVMRTARDDFNREIMAVKFSDTELFKKPIELKEIEQLLGKKISVRAPYRITTEAFIMIYNLGTLTPKER